MHGLAHVVSPPDMPATSPLTLRALWAAYERQDAPRVARLLCALARRGEKSPMASFSEHPFADDFTDFAAAAVADHLRQRQGIVYVVANPVNRGFYKIGVTAHDVKKRLRSLRSAGVVGEFVEVDAVFALDRFAAEKRAHRKMAAVAPQHKEFFVTDFRVASEAVQSSVAAENEVLTRAFPGVDLETSVPEDPEEKVFGGA